MRLWPSANCQRKMKSSSLLLLYCLIVLVFKLASAQPEFTTCLSPVCLSQSVTYECNSGANTLEWVVRDTNGARIDDAVLYSESSHSVGRTDSIGSQFNTVLTVDGPSLESNITFTPMLNISNHTVQCQQLSGIPVNCSIQIAAVPATLVLSNLTFTSSDVTISWSPSTSPCLSHYNVNVTSIEYTINTTDTSLSLPVPSTNDTEYSISVVAVDTGGRYMDPVDERTFVADVPEPFSYLLLNQSGLSINVSWDEPATPIYLRVLNYTLIYNNVLGSNTSITIPAPTTTYNIPDATVGSVYTVGVAASNVLGSGDIVLSTISIISTSVPPPTSSTPAMTMTVTPSVTSSPPVTSMSTSTQSTPATTPTSSPSAGGLDSTVYIGIGVGVAVIVIIILIILIVVGYVVWRKSKGEKDSTEPIALVDKKDHGSSPATGQPIYQEAMSSEDIKREAAPTTGELYAQPTKGSVRRPPPQPQSELATYQDPSTIQRTQAPTMEYLYAEVDKSKPQQQQAVYAQVDKDKKGGDGTVYADLDLKNTQGGPLAGNNPSNVIYSDVHNN